MNVQSALDQQPENELHSYFLTKDKRTFVSFQIDCFQIKWGVLTN